MVTIYDNCYCLSLLILTSESASVDRLFSVGITFLLLCIPGHLWVPDTEFYPRACWVLCCCSDSPSALSRVQFLPFCRHLRQDRAALGCTGLHWAGLGRTGLDWAAPGRTELHRAGLGCTRQLLPFRCQQHLSLLIPEAASLRSSCILLPFLGCCRCEGQWGPCCSILAGSRSNITLELLKEKVILSTGWVSHIMYQKAYS